MIREAALDVEAVVMSQLAWASDHPQVVSGEITPAEAPDRTELLLVTVHAPDWARAAMSQLRRPALGYGLRLPPRFVTMTIAPFNASVP